MNIYTFKTGDSSKYAYASGYRPFEGMSFFDDFPEHLKNSRIRSWEVNQGEPGMQIGDTGSRWPDLMECGNPPPSFVFSRKILASLESHGILPRRITPIPIGEIQSEKLKSVPHPDYFVIEALPGIEVDYAASGYVVDSDGLPDLNSPPLLPMPIPRYDPQTWTGADLFCQSNARHGPCHLTLLCTERVKEIALQDRWTNVSFQRLRVKGINPFNGLPE